MKDEMKRFAVRFNALLATALLVPIIGMTVAGTPAGSVEQTHLLTCTSTRSIEPTKYLLSCADANASFTNMKWTAWGSMSARGYGILRQNDCTPNCVSGKFVNYLSTVTLTKVVDSKKYGPLFSQATFRYTYHGKKMSEKFGLAD